MKIMIKKNKKKKKEEEKRRGVERQGLSS